MRTLGRRWPRVGTPALLNLRSERNSSIQSKMRRTGALKKLSTVITPASLQQNWIVCRFQSKIRAKMLKGKNKNCSRWAAHCKIIWKIFTLAKLAKERAMFSCWSMKNESVENYSVQYNGYNLIGVTTVERGDGNYASTGLFWITYAFI